MGATYTRQSSYTDGDVITAAHTNDEFDQLLAAFQASSGHTHDGTANEGGPITKLLGNTLTFGAGTAGTDITVTFDGESNDGVLKWMEDEDYFEFSDDILVASTEKLQFRDTAIYINSSTDGQLDLVADTLVQIATPAFTVDASGDITLDAGGADVVLKDDGTTFGSLTNSSGELVIKSGSTPTTAMTFSGANVTFAGTVTIGSAGISEAELEVLDGLTVTTAEVNILDGGTSATSTTVADADRVVLNDNGTMVQVAVTDLAAYFDDEITAMPNLVTTGALNSGSISTGFGAINNGSSAITTTGTVTFGSLSDGTITITGFADEDDFSSNSATLIPTQQSVKALVDSSFNVSGLNASGAELNTVADASAVSIDTSTAIANNDAILMHDSSASVMKYFDVDLLDTYYASTTQTLSNKTLTAPKIVDGGFIADANGNEAIVLQTASSAVNAIEITNSASGGAVVIGAMGDDTNVDIDISPKGSGEVNIAAGNLNYAGTAVTATGEELNILDGVTSTTAELNTLDGYTGSVTELNYLKSLYDTGVTSTEYDYLDGVTSNIQTQLNNGVTTGKSIAMAMVFG